MKSTSAYWGILFGVIAAIALIAMFMLAGALKAKASFLDQPCTLYVPKGAWTFDVAADLFAVALRHEAGPNGIESLSREDYEHAAKLVSACKP